MFDLTNSTQRIKMSQNFCTQFAQTSLIVLILAFAYHLYLQQSRFGHSLPFIDSKHPSSKLVTLSQGTTRYTLTGTSGDWIVFVHGLSMYSYGFKPFHKYFNKNRVLSYDLYGRGYSSAPDTTYNDSLFVAQLSELLYKLNVTEKIHLVGYSMGGGIVTKFASLYPEKIKSLVLIAAVGLPMELPFEWFLKIPILIEHFIYSESIQQKLSSVEKKFVIAEKAELVKKKMRKQFSGNPSYGAALVRSLRDFPWSTLSPAYEKVAREEFPVLILWGDKDSTVPYENAKGIKKIIPRAKFETIKGGEHYIVFEQEEQVKKILENFFTQ